MMAWLESSKNIVLVLLLFTKTNKYKKNEHDAIEWIITLFLGTSYLRPIPHRGFDFGFLLCILHETVNSQPPSDDS